MEWPDKKKFAFTIVDDTDCATIEKIGPVYDYLYKSGLRTTKTVWCYPPRDNTSGDSLGDERYRKFVLDLQKKGFEIAFHCAGSGKFRRDETIQALEMFMDIFGEYPQMHINHYENKDDLYWGSKRFIFPFSAIYNIVRACARKSAVKSAGECEDSEYFWGDFAKAHIRYMRNRVYSGINTLKSDPYMPYRERRKDKYSNYWFSSSDACNCQTFLNLVTKENIQRLKNEGGACILYTHFAFGFVDKQGVLNEKFKEAIDTIIQNDPYCATATELLDFVAEQRNTEYISDAAQLKMDFRWLVERTMRKLYLKV
jgi:hypothetical protein